MWKWDMCSLSVEKENDVANGTTENSSKTVEENLKSKKIF